MRIAVLSSSIIREYNEYTYNFLQTINWILIRNYYLKIIEFNFVRFYIFLLILNLSKYIKIIFIRDKQFYKNLLKC